MRTLTVTNTGRRAIRVSSHYPFDQVNSRLNFDRDKARGYRLDLPAGATLRWAPGEMRTVTLVHFGGATPE
jgi:urease subunit gamma/beta